jgi:nucleoside-specific outer membrane channel protein Tsx
MNLNQLRRTATFLAITALPYSPSFADRIWSDHSLSLLYGEDYEVDYLFDSDDATRRVVTYEYAAGYSWGDTFVFIDYLDSTDGNNEIYGEISPRLSLTSLSNQPWRVGPIKDTFIAATLEFSHFDSSMDDDQFANLLLGIGFSWDLPGFSYFNSNIYHANNEDEDDDQQLTLSWGLPFKIGNSQWLYDGFLDWSTAADDHHSSMNWTSQLKLDLGNSLGLKPKQLYVGIEYVYWNDKFGIKDQSFGFSTNERNLNALIKYHF